MNDSGIPESYDYSALPNSLVDGIRQMLDKSHLLMSCPSPRQAYQSIQLALDQSARNVDVLHTISESIQGVIRIVDEFPERWREVARLVYAVHYQPLSQPLKPFECESWDQRAQEAGSDDYGFDWRQEFNSVLERIRLQTNSTEILGEAAVEAFMSLLPRHRMRRKNGPAEEETERSDSTPPQPDPVIVTLRMVPVKPAREAARVSYGMWLSGIIRIQEEGAELYGCVGKKAMDSFLSSGRKSDALRTQERIANLVAFLMHDLLSPETQEQVVEAAKRGKIPYPDASPRFEESEETTSKE